MNYTFTPDRKINNYVSEDQMFMIEDNKKSLPEISEEEAIRQAEELLNKMHINDNQEYGLFQSKLAYSEGSQLETDKDGRIKFVRLIIFTKKFDGGQCNLGTRGNGKLVSVMNEQGYEVNKYLREKENTELSKDDKKKNKVNTDYGESFRSEAIGVFVDDSGIVGMSWKQPYKVVETVVPNSKLLSFDKIKSISKKMMLIQYEPYKLSKVRKETINCSNMNLEFQMIKEKGKNHSALIVPVWSLSGIDQMICEDDEKQLDKNNNLGDSSSMEDFLHINAVDGSAITDELHDGCVG